MSRILFPPPHHHVLFFVVYYTRLVHALRTEFICATACVHKRFLLLSITSYTYALSFPSYVMTTLGKGSNTGDRNMLSRAEQSVVSLHAFSQLWGSELIALFQE